MKLHRILPLLILAPVVCSLHAYADDTSSSSSPTLSQRADAAVDQAKQTATDAGHAISAKLTEWKLTPADIKADLEKSGRVVRDKTVAAGHKVGAVIDDARLVTVINAKFLADKDLSVLKIDVSADHGIVTLTGTVKSDELDGRAITLALDTDGVTRVISLLQVPPATK